MSATLKMAQYHDAAQMSYMEGVGCGVKTYVGCYLFPVEELFGTGHNLMDHTSPCQFFYKVYHLNFCFMLFGLQRYNS
ncbi:MAG: hypothetical protein BWY95_02543 [Bacteroidetes bacterium ADurb.BinA104]|nr:MAG: hypothetical protein BWY95_02543 [Bacteroidetes bacterium ADurb.BinA104]